MQGNSGVGEPGRTGVPESVAGQIRQADVDDELIPVRRIPHRRGREDIALWSRQKLVVGVLTCGETYEYGAQRVEDGHPAFLAILRSFGDQAALAGEDLAPDHDDVLVEQHVADLQARDFRGTGGEEGGEHHEVGI